MSNNQHSNLPLLLRRLLQLRLSLKLLQRLEVTSLSTFLKQPLKLANRAEVVLVAEVLEPLQVQELAQVQVVPLEIWISFVTTHSSNNFDSLCSNNRRCLSQFCNKSVPVTLNLRRSLHNHLSSSCNYCLRIRTMMLRFLQVRRPSASQMRSVTPLRG